MDVPVRASRTEPGSGDAVKAVSVVGTGTVRIRPEHLYGIGEQDTLTAQLATFGYAPADVDIAILSHLHQDHMGGLPELADTDLLVSADEWGELSRPGPELRGFLRSHIQLPGLRWRQVTMEQANDRNLAPFTQSLDVMGDGSLVLLPTPATRPDRCHCRSAAPASQPCCSPGTSPTTLTSCHTAGSPGVGRRRQLAESTRNVLALAGKHPGLVVLPAHDPTAARLLAS